MRISIIKIMPMTAPESTSAAPLPPPTETPALAAPWPRPVPLRRWTSRDLLGDAKEIEIEHDAMVYRLRLTGLGKLILTK